MASTSSGSDFLDTNSTTTTTLSKSPSPETENGTDTILPIQLHTDLLRMIFKLLTGTQMFKCRAVSKSWKEIIDELTNTDLKWKFLCKRDFFKAYKHAHNNAPKLTWFQLYKSLSQWSNIEKASMTLRFFTKLPSIAEDEITQFEIFDNQIGLKVNDYIEYYDLSTAQRLRGKAYTDIFYKYRENIHVIAFLDENMSKLLLGVKNCDFSNPVDLRRDFLHVDLNVTDFLIVDRLVYYITKYGVVNVCHNTTLRHLSIFPGNALTLSYTDKLHILTDTYDIFTLIDGAFIVEYAYTCASTLLHALHKFNFLDKIDWVELYDWIETEASPNPIGILSDISAAKSYGDLIFIGTEMNKLFVYNKPFIDERLSLLNVPPILEYDLYEIMKQEYGYVHNPAYQRSVVCIDVVEIGDGHNLFVATKSHLIVLEFRHLKTPREAKLEATKVIVKDNKRQRLET